MRIEQEKVRAFMEKIGDATSNEPTLVPSQTAIRRFRLIHEELVEYLTAATGGDLVEVADALGDVLYTVIGAGILHGIDLQPIFDEVHRSNMTKEPVRDNPLKLCAKGPNFEKPRIAEVLLLQSTGLNREPEDNVVPFKR